MTPSARLIADRAGLGDDYLVSLNGAVITLGEQVVAKTTLPQEVFATLCGLIRAQRLVANFYVGEEFYTRTGSPTYDDYCRRIQRQGHVVGDAVYDLRDVTKVLLFARDAGHKRELLATFGAVPGVSAISSQEFFVEVVTAGINKGAAVRTLAAHLGVGLENVLAVGDEWNDAEMIDAAGVGVVMGNGNAELKKGRRVTGPCRDGGVAQAIRTYALQDD